MEGMRFLYGSAAIDDNGSELWCSGNGHGDILHVGKFIKRPFRIADCCFFLKSQKIMKVREMDMPVR